MDSLLNDKVISEYVKLLSSETKIDAYEQSIKLLEIIWDKNKYPNFVLDIPKIRTDLINSAENLTSEQSNLLACFLFYVLLKEIEIDMFLDKIYGENVETDKAFILRDVLEDFDHLLANEYNEGFDKGYEKGYELGYRISKYSDDFR